MLRPWQLSDRSSTDRSPRLTATIGRSTPMRHDPSPDATAARMGRSHRLDAGTPTEAIAVVAPKGGQGKTTIAINLATGPRRGRAELGRARRRRPPVRRHHRGARRSNPSAPSSMRSADAAADELVLKTTLTHHDDGFFVVASAPSPELGDHDRRRGSRRGSSSDCARHSAT